MACKRRWGYKTAGLLLEMVVVEKIQLGCSVAYINSTVVPHRPLLPWLTRFDVGRFRRVVRYGAIGGLEIRLGLVQYRTVARSSAT